MVFGFHFRFEIRTHASRAVVSGTIDERFERGGLRYEYVLYDEANRIVDVQLGLTDEAIHIELGDETFDANGLPQAPLDLWDTLPRIARIVAGGPVTELPKAPNWQFEGGSGNHQSTLTHERATIALTLTLME